MILPILYLFSCKSNRAIFQKCSADITPTKKPCTLFVLILFTLWALDALLLTGHVPDHDLFNSIPTQKLLPLRPPFPRSMHPEPQSLPPRLHQRLHPIVPFVDTPRPLEASRVLLTKKIPSPGSRPVWKPYSHGRPQVLLAPYTPLDEGVCSSKDDQRVVPLQQTR